MEIRNRIKRFEMVPAAELRRNPKNWRTHPEFQRKALTGILEQIGFAGAVIARECEDGTLELIDGHERCEIADTAHVPTLVLDVTAEEADLLLATFDPIRSLAEADAATLHALIGGLDVADQYARQLLEDLKDENPIDESSGSDAKRGSEVLLDQAVQLRPQREYVVVMCGDDPGEFERLKVALGLGPVRRGGYKEGSAFDQSGIQRVIHARKLLELLEGVGRDSIEGSSGKGQESASDSKRDAVRSRKRSR